MIGELRHIVRRRRILEGLLRRGRGEAARPRCRVHHRGVKQHQGGSSEGDEPVRDLHRRSPRGSPPVKEEVGEYRIIPLDGRPALGPKIRQYLGEARGRWEGDTLVVETTNVNDQQDGGPMLPVSLGVAALISPETEMYPGSGETLRVIERYRRLDDETIEYRATIEDPAVYTRPYTILHELGRDDAFFEAQYQCHENNEHFMAGILASARADSQTSEDLAREAATRWRALFDKLRAEWATWDKQSR